MSIQKRTVFQVTDPRVESKQSWSVSFSRDGDFIVIGLHWNDKAIPTHQFEAEYSEFVKAMAELS